MALKIEMATSSDIEKLIELRILQQKDDWQEEYEDKMNLKEKKKVFK